MKSKVKIHILFFVLGLFFIFLPACQGNTDNSHAPEFTLLNLAGDTVNLSDYKGKVVIINFFATYCPPCRMEMPDFVELQKRFGSKNFTVLAISVDNDGEKVLPPFVEKLGLNFPVLLATSKVLEDYGNIYALPVTFVLDKDHKIVKKITGMINKEELIPLIEKLLSTENNSSS